MLTNIFNNKLNSIVSISFKTFYCNIALNAEKNADVKPKIIPNAIKSLILIYRKYFVPFRN
jgi:hypothetical protein